MKKEDVYYRAVVSRDSRFDGKFFIGVKSTGIYCRPICPAQPQRKNMLFFDTGIQAENAGFRPCKRCRPEDAPGRGHASHPIVRAALAAIDEGEYHDDDAASFAALWELSDRHLRRLFVEELGQSPAQIAASRRLNACRKLLIETDLSITTIAFDSGFQSIRRFNDAFKKRFHHTPSHVRKLRGAGKRASAKTGGVILKLPYRPPFDWQDALGYFRSHGFGDFQRVTDNAYERLILGDDNQSVSFLRVTCDDKKHQLLCEIHTPDSTQLLAIARRVRLMFDLDADPLHTSELFREVPILSELVERYPGLRICRSFDPLEAVISTILGQLVSVQQAANLSAQVAASYGSKARHPLTGEEFTAFPTLAQLAAADFAAIGTTTRRRQALRAVIGAVHAGDVSLQPHQNVADFQRALLAIRGIGPWTAEYLTLRALGDTDGFPATDLILNRALDLHPGLRDHMAALRPWRSYAAVYLWRHYAKLLSGKNAHADETARRESRRG